MPGAMASIEAGGMSAKRRSYEQGGKFPLYIP
jgi:hypothetical protein